MQNNMYLQNILFYSVILPNILLFCCRIFVFGLTWKILFRSYPNGKVCSVIRGVLEMTNNVILNVTVVAVAVVRSEKVTD